MLFDVLHDASNIFGLQGWVSLSDPIDIPSRIDKSHDGRDWDACALYHQSPTHHSTSPLDFSVVIGASIKELVGFPLHLICDGRELDDSEIIAIRLREMNLFVLYPDAHV